MATGGSAGKWETQVGALDLIAVVCGKAPEQVSQVLAETVTCTSDLMNASKKQVADPPPNFFPCLTMPQTHTML